MAKRTLKRTTKPKEEKSIEQTIWDEANKLRGKVEPSEYKHVVLSLIFLKYASDRFNAHRKQMIAKGEQLFLELRPFYARDNVFYVPECSRWAFIMANKSQPDIAIKIDTALHELEKENPALKDALPDNYFSRLRLDSDGLSSLLDDIDVLKLQLDGDKDLFGRVYQFCLRKFALMEGKSKGEFYTPDSVVELLCDLIEPYSGIVYDGACGSGGMFVQSMKFVDEHKGNRLNVSIYGQEYTDATRRLAKMNLAIRGISANLGEEPADTFKKDQHRDLKAQFALENPPFNQKDWRGDNELTKDPRWSGYITPPTSNANYAWLLNTLSKLGQNGVGAVLLANGSLSAGGDEYEIRKRLIENDCVEAIITLPHNMFYTTDISATVWILNRNKKAHVEKRPSGNIAFRDRTSEVLFMDLRQMGHPYEKRYIEFTEKDRAVIVDRFKSWRFENYETPYMDVPEFCYAAKTNEIINNGYSLVPSRYIEFVYRDESVDYEERMIQLQRELRELFVQEQQSKLNLLNVMKGLGYEIRL